MKNKFCKKCKVKKNIKFFNFLKYSCDDCVREQNRKKMVKWRKENPEKYRFNVIKMMLNRTSQKQHENYLKRREKHLLKGREYYYKHKENKIVKNKLWRRNRRHTDIHFKIKCNISNLINRGLRNRLLSKNGKSSFNDLLPYTVEELKYHLENQFEPWMNWNNWGRKIGCWNIDHKKADSLFNYKSTEDEEFQKCWSLENLQPMEWIENIKKSNKII